MEGYTVTTTGAERREQGIEFGDLDAALATHEYPVTTATVLSVHGDHQLGLSDETRTLREVLGPLVDDEHDTDMMNASHESPEEVRQLIFTAVDSDAIGREEYTDRDPETRQEAQRRGEESL